ncbi:hypothetical protein NKDENANG_02614 [Candidatus Entotheonellaceae bacterium PAL068K]
MQTDASKIEAGVLTFALQYRTLMPDQGVCIQVVGDVDGRATQLLRFDCFDQRPHYHYDPDHKNERFNLDKTTAGNPIGWTVKQLRTRLPAMLVKAGYEEIAQQLDTELLRARLDEVEDTARGMALTQRRTVTHNRGDVVIEADNIRFGLEFRHLRNDRGLAIHVLSDVAGQEIELLAFDCFERAPHYHYGPRNQDIRIYWDMAVVPDPLAWTLEQFKSGKLRSMIERAGYPSIAASLDEDLIAGKLEQEVAPRALAIRAENTQ